MPSLDKLLEPRAPSVLPDEGGSVRRRVCAHIQWALRHVFRGRMTVDTKIEVEEEAMVVDIRARIRKWSNSAIDQMDEALHEPQVDLDEVYACLHELVAIVPRPSVTGPKGPGLFQPMSNDKALALSQLLDRAREVL